MLGLGSAASRLVSHFSRKATRTLYIATGTAHGHNNRAEYQRLEDLAVRRSARLKPRRIVTPNEHTLPHYDGIACLGNAFTVSTYEPYHQTIYPFSNHGDPRIAYQNKDFNAARTDFLYFASHGQVHKGLDLLLEAFSTRPQYRLHVCSHYETERDFVRCYSQELYRTPNILAHGWVHILGSRFREICQACSCSILPSCAEANVGSMIACMHAGLIPIVSKECGIDTDNVGVTLPSCSLEDITTAIDQIATQPAAWHREHSAAARAVSVRDYSQEAFTQRWENILTEFETPSRTVP
jgi:glycosyltransferase involved in cell wall biosynthesis